MKKRAIFASAAIIATLASQTAQVVSATTIESQDENTNNTVVENDSSDNSTSDNVTSSDNADNGGSDINENGNTTKPDNNGNQSDKPVINNDKNEEHKNPSKPKTPIVNKPVIKAAPKKSTGTFGPGAYDNSTIKKVTGINDTINNNIVGDMPVTLDAKEFFEKISDGAIEGWGKYKVLPSVTMAQAAIESGWGASGLTARANNLFGIKGSYEGQSTVMSTQEQDSTGSAYWIDASFRKYPSWRESLEDHGKFLQSNSRYHNLLGKKDYKEVTALLKQDGYATAVNYSEILNKIIETYDLTKYDDQAFNGKTGNNGEEKNISGTVFITNANGAELYTSPNGEKVQRILSSNTNWKIDRIYTENGQTWYQVGKDAWVRGSDVSIGKSNAKKTTSVKLSTTRKVNNVQGAKIFSSPYSNNKFLNRVLPTKSSWKIDRVETIKGKTWYRVGKSQWVSQTDLSNESNNPKPSKTSGVKTITNVNGGKLYSSPFSDGEYLNKTLSTGTSWQVDQVVHIKGITWYRVGKDMWINNTAWN